MSARLLILLAVPFLLALAGCPIPECFDDDACGGGFCVDGACVECLAATDCGDGELCCSGSCRAEEVEAACGCAADPRTGETGSACASGQICLAGEARASAANLAEGTCGCPCDPLRGGTVCSVDEAAEAGFSCSCDRDDQVGTCEAPVLDEAGRPHRVADTCAPSGACVCFAAEAGGPCLEGDCTEAGCVDLLSSPESCGVAGRSCTEEATGVPDTGACVSGGCTCNAASDCAGEGLNVDSCQFVGQGEVTQCVCDDYSVGGLPAACPMGLPCAEGGCVVDGTAYAEEAALFEALTR